MGFFGGAKEYVGVPQQPLGFAMALNMWDLARSLEPDNFHCHPQPLHVIGFSFVTTLVLDRQAHIFFEYFLGFLSCKLMVQSGHFLCNVFFACMWFRV